MKHSARLRGFTLIELLAVVCIIGVLSALLLPALAAARKRTVEGDAPQVALKVGPALLACPPPGAQGQEPKQPQAIVKSFEATVSLTPQLSVGTADPESIYTAAMTARFQVFNPAKTGDCEVQLPLPPQIISLGDVAITVNGKPSEFVSIRGDKLVWSGPLPAEPTPMSITYSAVGKGLYNLQTPPSGILDTFHIDLTAVGSDVRMLELSLQPTRYAREDGKTIYTWEYQRLLFGRPIVVDVLGIAPIDRLGELTWLGPLSVVLFGLLIGLFARAYPGANCDRWTLLLIIGTFTGAYPLMYFAQEFIPIGAAILASAGLVLLVLSVFSVARMGFGVGLGGVVLPAAAIYAMTLLASMHTRLQGMLITAGALALFVIVMALMPRLKMPLPRAVQMEPA